MPDVHPVRWHNLSALVSSCLPSTKTVAYAFRRTASGDGVLSWWGIHQWLLCLVAWALRELEVASKILIFVLSYGEGSDRTFPLSSMRQLTNSPKIAAPVVSPVSVAPTICAALSSWTYHLLAHRDKEDWSSLNCELSCVTPLAILLKVAMTDPPPMAIMDTYTLREACHTVYTDGNMSQRREWREYSGTARFRNAMKR